MRGVEDGERFVESRSAAVQVVCVEPHLDTPRITFDRQHGCTRHGRRQRLRAAHAAQAAGEDPFSLQIAAVVLPAGLGKGFVGALHDALAADVDPRTGRHLAEHHEPLGVEFVEVLPGGPVRYQVGVGDQHPRCVSVGLQHADRLARLDEQGLVVLQCLQHFDDLVEAGPIARRAADAAVDDQFLGLLRDLRIEVVHEHAQRRFGEPGLG